MKAPVYNLTGAKTKDLILDKDLFASKINKDLIAQATRVYLANQRSAQAKTQTRSEVDRTTKKIYRQKGTGGARHGSRRAPIYVGGGVALGPDGTQNYSLKLSKKMKIAALKSALSQKASEGELIIIEGLTTLKEIKTKIISNLIEKILKNPRKVFLVFDKDMSNAQKSSRNISYINCLSASKLTTYEVLNAKTLALSLESLKTLKERLGE